MLVAEWLIGLLRKYVRGRFGFRPMPFVGVTIGQYGLASTWVITRAGPIRGIYKARIGRGEVRRRG